MNKQKFISALRNPTELSPDQLKALRELVKEHPYFMSARTALAKAVKEKFPDKAERYISSASVYVTDRALFKKYLSDHLYFLNKTEPIVEEEEPKPARQPQKPTPKKKSSKERPQVRNLSLTPIEELEIHTTSSDLDKLIEEVYQDMADLKQ